MLLEETGGSVQVLFVMHTVSKLLAAQHCQVCWYDDADGGVHRTYRNQGSYISQLSLMKQITVLVKVLPWEVGKGRRSGSDLDVSKSDFIGVGELLEAGLDVSQLVPQCSILLTHIASLLCTSPQPSGIAQNAICEVLATLGVQRIRGCACCVRLCMLWRQMAGIS